MSEENERMNMPIDQLIEGCTEYLQSLGYSSHSIKMYSKLWNLFLKYANNQNEEKFTKDLALKYMKEKYNLGEDSAPKGYHRNIQLSLRRLSEYQNYHYSPAKTRIKQKVHSPAITSLLDDFYMHYSEKVTTSTLSRTKHDIEKFAIYLTDSGITDFRQVTLDDIHKFIISLKRYSPKTITDILARIRFLCQFSFETGCCDEDYSKRISKIRCVTNKFVPDTYTASETEILLKSVDRGSPVGKRDYAILLLAVRFGLRASDIRQLKLENICWDTDSISLTQRKTSEPLSLPLTSEIGEALIDYLKNGRPQTESRTIFICHIAPYKEFGGHNSMYQIMKKYLTIAGINTENKQKGLHSLRHSLAGTLLENDVSLPVISNILGHTNSNTTGEYLKIDFNNLRKCALEVSI